MSTFSKSYCILSPRPTRTLCIAILNELLACTNLCSSGRQQTIIIIKVSSFPSLRHSPLPLNWILPSPPRQHLGHQTTPENKCSSSTFLLSLTSALTTHGQRKVDCNNNPQRAPTSIKVQLFDLTFSLLRSAEYCYEDESSSLRGFCF